MERLRDRGGVPRARPVRGEHFEAGEQLPLTADERHRGAVGRTVRCRNEPPAAGNPKDVQGLAIGSVAGAEGIRGDAVRIACSPSTGPGIDLIAVCQLRDATPRGPGQEQGRAVGGVSDGSRQCGHRAIGCLPVRRLGPERFPRQDEEKQKGGEFFQGYRLCELHCGFASTCAEPRPPTSEAPAGRQRN